MRKTFVIHVVTRRIVFAGLPCVIVRRIFTSSFFEPCVYALKCDVLHSVLFLVRLLYTSHVSLVAVCISPSYADDIRLG